MAWSQPIDQSSRCGVPFCCVWRSKTSTPVPESSESFNRITSTSAQCGNLLITYDNVGLCPTPRISALARSLLIGLNASLCPVCYHLAGLAPNTRYSVYPTLYHSRTRPRTPINSHRLSQRIRAFSSVQHGRAIAGVVH